MRHRILDAPYRKMRIAGLLGLFLLGIGLIIVRLILVTWYQGYVFIEQSEKNYTRFESLMPIRGSIFDAYNRPLAVNEIVFDLYWQGTKKSTLSEIEDDILLCKKMGTVLHESQDLYARRGKKSILLVEGVLADRFIAGSEVLAARSSLTYEARIKRRYPYQTLASHLIGYVQQKKSSISGVAGLEHLLQKDLEGEPGQVKKMINARGIVLQKDAVQEALSGKNIQITIDIDLQKIAEESFLVHQSGALVIMDPDDGSICALVSYPNYNPNRFLEPLSSYEWEQEFQNQKSPLLNRATHGMYPAASLFKVVTFAAGLEEGIITPETLFTCKGHIVFCGRKYYCQRAWGHGVLDSRDALAYSCNIPCYEIGQKLDIDVLAWYAYELGLGNKTGLFLPEKSGLMPTKAWKQAVKHESWWQGETLSASIGQSFIMVTPLQMACMIGAIFTGYRVRPRIIMDEAVEKYPVALSESTRLFLQQSMALGVQKGTSRRLSTYEQFTIHAKTGTAQISNLRTKKEKYRVAQFEHGWTAVHFRYKDQKPYVLIVLVEHAGTSRAATEIAQKIIKQYGKLQK